MVQLALFAWMPYAVALAVIKTTFKTIKCGGDNQADNPKDERQQRAGDLTGLNWRKFIKRKIWPRFPQQGVKSNKIP